MNQQAWLLSDMCSMIQYGYTASASSDAIGPRFLRITDIVPDLINWESVPYCGISENDREKYLLSSGDIVIARTGATTGYAKQIYDPPEAVFASYLIRIRINEELADPRFVGIVVQSTEYKKFVQSHWGGAAQPNANAKTLTAYKFILPERTDQERIVEILLAYDDLITANQRRILLLEESARLLYREWFMLLKFPGHETVPVTDGVPVGWERKAVSEMVDANPRTPFPKDVSRPFVGMEALSEDSMIIDVSDARPISGGAKFRNGDTLLARITPCLENGKTGFVQFLEDDEAAASGSTEFIVLRSRTVNPYWIYCLARSDSFREHAINSMAGSDGRQRVNSKCFDKYLTLQPPSDVLQAFEDNVSGMFAQVQSLTEYNSALRQAREMLLPKLMSGALDVSRIAVPKEVEV